MSWDAAQILYREADVFLFTSVRDTFGAQLMEASAAGLPIIGLDLHGVADHVPAGAIKVPIVNPDQAVDGLAKAIVRFGVDTVRREARLASRRFAEMNAWQARAEATTSVYAAIVEGSGAVR